MTFHKATRFRPGKAKVRSFALEAPPESQETYPEQLDSPRVETGSDRSIVPEPLCLVATVCEAHCSSRSRSFHPCPLQKRLSVLGSCFSRCIKLVLDSHRREHFRNGTKRDGTGPSARRRADVDSKIRLQFDLHCIIHSAVYSPLSGSPINRITAHLAPDTRFSSAWVDNKSTDASTTNPVLSQHQHAERMKDMNRNMNSVVAALVAIALGTSASFAQSPSTPTTTVVTMTPASTTVGSSVSADVQVTSSSGAVPTGGTVSCSSSGAAAGPVALSNSGIAAVQLNGLSQGTDAVLCTYSGTTVYETSSGQASETVGAYQASPACVQAAENIYNHCMAVATGRQECWIEGYCPFSPPPAALCPNSVATIEQSCSTMDVFVGFQLQSILYAPPGNKSSVGFTNSVSDGQNTSLTNSFSTTNQLGLSFSLAGFSFGASYQIQSTESTMTAAQATVQNQLQSTWPSTSDAIDHTQDLLSIWLNPQIEVAHSSVGDDFVPSTYATQYVQGNSQYDPIGGVPYADAPSGDMSIVTASVAALRNPTLLTPGQLVSQNLDGYTVAGLLSLCTNRMPENQCTQAQAATNGCGCKASDFAAIVAQDPFFSPSILSQTGNLTPTLAQVNAADPNNARYVPVLDNTGGDLYLLLDGTNPSTQTFTLTDTNNTSETFTNTVTQTANATFGYKSSSGGSTSGSTPTSFGFTSSNSATWTNTESVGSSSSIVHTQSLLLGTSTAACYENIAVYEDTLYHTYVYQSTSNAPNPCP